MCKHRAGSSWLQGLVTVSLFAGALDHVDLEQVLNDIATCRVVSSQP
jgi:hypothetical protein